LNLTKQLGGKESTARTPEQTAIAFFWADGAGSVTPPGHWNLIARDVALQKGNTLEQNSRLFALLNLAEADAGIACWDCKFAANYWRPITAIQHAGEDGNAATEPDPKWEPLLPTPPFPEYTSGHSTFSGAAATVLASFFGEDNIQFTTTADALPGFSRTFNSFWEAAAEAGMSRIYGGIHFMSANQQGLLCGTRIAAYVTEKFLLEKPEAAAPLAAAVSNASSEAPAPVDPVPPPVAATPPPAASMPSKRIIVVSDGSARALPTTQTPGKP
jgi:hypothetical protein